MKSQILVIIGSGNCLPHVLCQAITWTNARLEQISVKWWIQILNFPVTKIHLKILSATCRPLCSGLHKFNSLRPSDVYCVSKLTTIGSDNGLSPGRRQAIIWSNAGILLIGPLGTNFSEILIEMYTFSFKKMHLKILSGKCWGLNEFNISP